MDHFRQKPLESQKLSIFVLKVEKEFQKTKYEEDEPDKVQYTLGYFTTLAKALQSARLFWGDWGHRHCKIEEAFVDPPALPGKHQDWLPLTVSETKIDYGNQFQCEVPDWQFVPEAADYITCGLDTCQRSQDVIEELKSQIVRLQSELSAQACTDP